MLTRMALESKPLALIAIAAAACSCTPGVPAQRAQSDDYSAEINAYAAEREMEGIRAERANEVKRNLENVANATYREPRISLEERVERLERAKIREDLIKAH